MQFFRNKSEIIFTNYFKILLMISYVPTYSVYGLIYGREGLQGQSRSKLIVSIFTLKDVLQRAGVRAKSQKDARISGLVEEPREGIDSTSQLVDSLAFTLPLVLDILVSYIRSTLPGIHLPWIFISVAGKDPGQVQPQTGYCGHRIFRRTTAHYNDK